ncbi:hypothetical protein Hanom_Chr02g00112491 [Helianthus anomalus]
MMVGDAEVAGWWSEMRGVVWLQVGEKLGTMKGFCWLKYLRYYNTIHSKITLKI